MFNFNKLVITLLLIACLSLRANAALSVVQVVSNTASNSPTVSATLASTTAGNLIVVSSWWSTTGRTFTSISDNKSDTYSAANNTSATGQVERIDFVGNALGAVTSVTLTISGNSNVAIVVYEIAGATTVSPLDSTAVANSASATTLAASLTTTNANDIVISGFCNGDTSVDTAHDASMTVDKDLNATAGGRFGAGSRIVSSVLTASDEGWTTAGAATAWAIVTASFKQAAVNNTCNNKIALMGMGCT